MVPKLHAKGSSFKGAASYLLHDKDRAPSSDRVAWTQTRNLASEDPNTAWKIMAATALDQARLKQQAGVKNTGRKSDKHVLHFTLAWHPDQDPDRDEMMKAANGAIKALGASKHQALIIAHNDEKHPHLHVMINRVSPQDGRHLSSSKEKLKLSKWAQAYEEESGQVLCEQRVTNNLLRSQGHYVRGEKNAPRHIFEQQKAAAANDNPHYEAVREGQKSKDADIAGRGRDQAKRHKAQWDELDQSHRQSKAGILHGVKRDMARAGRKILEDYKPKITETLKRQRAEVKTFDALEATLFGRAKNAVSGLNLLKRVYGDERGSLLSRGFAVLTRASARRELIDKAHAKEIRDLKVAQNKETRAERAKIKERGRDSLSDQDKSFTAERSALVFKQGLESASLRSEWRQRRKDRASAWDKFAEFSAKRKRTMGDFKAAGAKKDNEGYKASVLARQARLAARMSRESEKDKDTKKDRDTDT